MTVVWRWAEHTGELEVEVEAPTAEALFVEGLAAMAELLGDDERTASPAEELEHEVALSATDRSLLFADWLAELAVLAETEGFVAGRVKRIELTGDGLRATVAGHRGMPPHLVKAVTLHRLLFAHADGGWRARAILDV